jgi:methylphosphotriester-DNA--protein-cysteine methyltransferase
VRHRVFFADEATAIAAGYRPCAVCLPERYALWKRACVQAGIPPLAQARLLRQPALEIYRRLVEAEAAGS